MKNVKSLNQKRKMLNPFHGDTLPAQEAPTVWYGMQHTGQKPMRWSPTMIKQNNSAGPNVIVLLLCYYFLKNNKFKQKKKREREREPVISNNAYFDRPIKIQNRGKINKCENLFSIP